MNRLKLWRLQAGLTQAEAAKRLRLGKSTFAILESGRLRPTVRQREHLREYFGREAESLFAPVSERIKVQPRIAAPTLDSATN